ncbi:ABC transporter permease [Altererythrobacter sp. CC-YST694]|uniref:ABC transporter permease n=1 Tax=Altererythrobacter sp. CC-YST694 TaxID=2755038 RepID=UPI001D0049FC|nr:ABC transporter permease [Altererythrobacter sp. CC-YST694]MCB5425600.1 ABC transporter permease [Altererythrobacter sp. CC-YST694]
MSQSGIRGGRLSTVQAAFVVARRDFVAILLSRTFIFFLLGPLFPLIVGGLAGGIGEQVQQEAAQPEIGIAMQGADVDRMLAAYDQLAPRIGPAIPRMVELRRLSPGETFDARSVLEHAQGDMAAIVTGTPASPELTATQERLEWWKGPVGLISAQALQRGPIDFPPVKLASVATSGAKEKRGRVATAQVGQTVLFLLIMLLAGMVLSNLVEEKANKIIEVLAAAIPMDAVFLGKLFAMLAVSLVGITVWATVIGGLVGLAGMQDTLPAGMSLADLPTPGVGWPLFFLLGVIYFAMGYLLLGSIFLSIGSMAATVREVQTLSMPVTMLQVLIFFFSAYALTQTGKPMELAAIAFPLSSPFAMLARAATDDALWPHLAALTWQAIAVAIFVKVGSALFRKRVMKSGPQHGVKKRRGLLAILNGRGTLAS